MSITIRFFATLREQSGHDSYQLPYSDELTIDGALKLLVSDNIITSDIANAEFICAKNHEYVTRDATLQDGDELALIPPVSGG